MHLDRSDSGLAYGVQGLSSTARPEPGDSVVVTWTVRGADVKSDIEALNVNKATFKVAQLLPGLAEGIQFGTGIDRIHKNDDSSWTVIRADAMFRPGPTRRHEIDLSYAGFHRDGNATLSEDVTIDGTTYTAGANVDSLFNFDIIRSTYTYALLQNDRGRVALGLGAYVIPVKYRLDIDTNSGRSRASGADTVIPFPVASLRAEFQIIPKLFFNLSMDGMYLEAGGFTGTVFDGIAAFEYRPWNHFGLGLGYNGMNMKVVNDTDKKDYPGVDFAGSVKVRYNGLLLYGKYSF
jgi:hypothetical protein